MIYSDELVLPREVEVFDHWAQSALVSVISGELIIQLEHEPGCGLWKDVGTVQEGDAPFFMPVRLGRWRFVPSVGGTFNVEV